MIWWILKKLFKNLGRVTPEIYRSGQPGIFRLFVMLLIMRPKTRINLAYSPHLDEQDPREKKILDWLGIKYYAFAWGAAGPPNWSELDWVANLIDSSEKPVWIGCEGGLDRTGGLIARWKQCHGYQLEEIFLDWKYHGIPAWPWVEYLFIKKWENL